MTTDFKNTVLKKLISAPCCVIAINSDEQREAVELIIAWGQDKDNGFEITFPDDYKRIKKHNINFPKKIKHHV